MTTEAPFPSITMRGRISSVTDGDTLTFVVPERVIHVRLLGGRPPGATENRGVWAPEIKGDEKPLGLLAKAHLQSLIDHRTEFVLRVPTDNANDVGDITTMGRVLGEVFADGVNLGEAMIEAGHATATKEKKEPQ